MAKTRSDGRRLKADVISIFIVGDFRKFFNIFGFSRATPYRV